MAEASPSHSGSPATGPTTAIEAGRDAMRDALRRSASALKAADIPFALAGSYALWVHGGPEGSHDVDLVVPEACVEPAAGALAAAGFDIERPPEDWLFKAWRADTLVDVLHRLVGVPIELPVLRDAEEQDVCGVRMPVLAPTVVMLTKLLSLNEQYCDFATLLPYARAVRERIDWDRIRSEVTGHPFAETFVHLLDRLKIID